MMLPNVLFHSISVHISNPAFPLFLLATCFLFWQPSQPNCPPALPRPPLSVPPLLPTPVTLLVHLPSPITTPAGSPLLSTLLGPPLRMHHITPLQFHHLTALSLSCFNAAVAPARCNACRRVFSRATCPRFSMGSFLATLQMQHC